MARIARLVVAAVLCGCGEDGEEEESLSDFIGKYADALERSTDVTCGMCWEPIGHPSEESCRMEAENDQLTDAQRACYEELPSSEREDLLRYLRCAEAHVTAVDDCMAETCDASTCYQMELELPEECTEDVWSSVEGREECDQLGGDS